MHPTSFQARFNPIIMKHIVLIQVIILFSHLGLIHAYGQDILVYNLPPKVQKKAQAYISHTMRQTRRHNKPNMPRIGFIMDSDENYYILKCFTDCERDVVKNDVESPMVTDCQTNRYVRIKDDFYPMYTIYDTFFCETDTTKLQRFGCRYGFPTVHVRSLIFDGYKIYFDKESINLINKKNSRLSCGHNKKRITKAPHDSLMEKMVFFFSDEVESEVWKYMNRIHKETSDLYSFLLRKEENAFRLFFVPSSNDRDNPLNQIMTNRYVIIDDNYYPLYFDYDFVFGEPYKNIDISTMLSSYYYVDIHRNGWFLGRKETDK